MSAGRHAWLRRVALGVALLAAAQVVAVVGAPQRSTAGLDALPPGEFAGTLMLGGLRGLACDLLWLRAVSAKDDGRFYESVALAEAITRVQPRFVDVWQALAHDLAYNIAYEADGPEQRFSWFMAGVRANIRGVERNPDVERLLRHLAWMFHHKGDQFRERIVGTDLSPLIDPLLAGLRRRHGDDPRFADLPHGPGASNFIIANRLYAACVALGDVGGADAPSYVRRMVAHTLDADANRLRNHGEHLTALRRWLDAGAAWAEIQAWIDQPHLDRAGRNLRAATAEVLGRNEGRVRRRAAELALALAPDQATGVAMATAIMQRRWADARRLVAEPGWRETVGDDGRVRWLGQ